MAGEVRHALTGKRKNRGGELTMKMWRIGIIVMLLLVGTIGPLSAQGQGKKPDEPVGGEALYPDLITLEPTNLYFDVVTMSDGLAHYVLRFDNTVGNTGSGRLELEGQKRSKIYQNVYDAAVGGNLVERHYIGNDSIFHEGHNHYHIENFASYQLFQDGGEWTKQGTKTSFCVMDVVPIVASYGDAQYTTCGRSIQGLTVGWGDTYYASLAEQWIDLGTSPLPDGAYMLQSTANPNFDRKLIESDYGNNTASTCFTVTSGMIDEKSIVAC